VARQVERRRRLGRLGASMSSSPSSRPRRTQRPAGGGTAAPCSWRRLHPHIWFQSNVSNDNSPLSRSPELPIGSVPLANWMLALANQAPPALHARVTPSVARGDQSARQGAL